jgi:hypothetical protein
MLELRNRKLGALEARIKQLESRAGELQSRLDGLEDHLGVAVGLAGEVPVDPEPQHLAPLRHLGLADDRHVVLALAGDHARVAADAGVQVDRHPPLVPLIVGMLLPE